MAACEQPKVQSLSRLLVSLCLIIFFTAPLLPGLFLEILFNPRKLFWTKRRDSRPSCLDDSKFGIHGFAKLSSIRMHYVVNGPDDKPLMLFLHGFPEFWYSWRHQITAFCKDFRTVAVDLRGYGETEKPAGILQYTMEKLVEDVKEMIEFLGYKSCIVVGHDWGAFLGQCVAIAYPEMVDRLVICNVPHAKAMERHLKSSWSQLRKIWYQYLFQVPNLAELLLRRYDFKSVDNIFQAKAPGCEKAPCNAEETEAYKYSLSQPGGLTGPLNYYRAVHRYTLPYARKTIAGVPTLIIWGERDIALEKKTAEMSVEHIEDCRLRFINNAGHWVQMDQPYVVNNFIREFVSETK